MSEEVGSKEKRAKGSWQLAYTYAKALAYEEGKREDELGMIGR